MSELLEKMEEAGHAEHHDHGAGLRGGIGKFVGLTMAILGVLLALSSAMVGSARTHVIATMVEQTNTSLQYQSISTKHRMLQAQLLSLHALMPDQKQFDALEHELTDLERDVKNPETAKTIRAVRLEAKKILNTVTPNRPDVLRFAELVRKYDRERQAARDWAVSYEDAIEADAHAAEHFEWGQLAAEIGIVLASIALLLQNKQAWVLSIALGVASIGLVGWTYATARGIRQPAEAKIEETKAHFIKLSIESSEKDRDAALLRDIESGAR